jgi:hypothetical protein
VLNEQFKKIVVNIMISMWRKHFSLFMFFVCDVARKNTCDRHRPLKKLSRINTFCNTQVSGACPLNSLSTQAPKAICTARGEWLITDQNLDTRCQCSPGHEFHHGRCLPCPLGHYKPTASNRDVCTKCPANSWSVNLYIKR